MAKVLVINASSRSASSMSRYMTKTFVESWQAGHPNDTVSYREVGQGMIPHISEKWITAAFKPTHLRTKEEVEELKLSDLLITELKEADVIVLGTPMYNWSVPSSLKAYIDQVMRVQETIQISKDDLRNPYRGFMKNKKVYILMVRGNFGYDPGEFYEHMDFQTNYLKTVFRIMGIPTVDHLAINGVDAGPKDWESAAEKIRSLINL